VRIVFDQGTPVPLRRYLATHSVTTAFELGWSQLNNGELLTAAEAQFDALITTDQHLHQQQNLLNRKLLFWCYRSRAGRSWNDIPPKSCLRLRA
jgi:hypothetical protein